LTLPSYSNRGVGCEGQHKNSCVVSSLVGKFRIAGVNQQIEGE